MSKLLNLQALRFIAAFIVLIYHGTGLYARTSGQLDLRKFTEFGFVGVDIFFVISGFIMWVTTKRNSGIGDASEFMVKRAVRVYITLWIVLAIYTAYLWHFSPSRLLNANIINTFLLIPQPTKESVLGITWTLSYELYFYALVAIAIALGGRLMLLAVSAGAVVMMVLGRIEVPVPFPLVTTGAPILEFFAGCAVGIAYERGLIKYPIRWILTGITLLIAAIIYSNATLVHSLGDFRYLDLRVALLLPMAVCIVAGTVALDKIYKPKKWLVILGDASYGIYLWHLPVFVMWFDKVRDKQLSDLTLIATWILAIVITLALSVLCTRFIEKPVMNVLFKRRVVASVFTA